MEKAEVGELFAYPLHPYTRALLSSIPRPDGKRGRLEAIPGSVPDLIDPPSGCRFHPRCREHLPICNQEEPALKEVDKEHEAACHLL